MKDCWKQLGISPTNDPAEIKRAWRVLVKQYHPDTVKTPEKKRKYTIRCAEINGAYRDALQAAQTEPISGPTRTSWPDSPAAKETTRQTWFHLATPVFSTLLAITVIIAVFAGLHYIIVGLGALSKANPIRVALAFVVSLFVGIMILGGIVAGTLDLLLVAMFPRRLLEVCGLAEYEDKLVWLSITACNVFLFFYSELLGKPSGFDEPVSTVLDLVLRSSAAATIPTLLALDWLRDVLRLRRLNKTRADVIVSIATIDT